MRSGRIFLTVGLVLLVAIAFLVVVVGGGGRTLANSCKRDAEAMGLNWVYSTERGCFVQQPNGEWMPIDRIGVD